MSNHIECNVVLPLIASILGYAIRKGFHAVPSSRTLAMLNSFNLEEAVCPFEYMVATIIKLC